MDDPGIPSADHLQALTALARINRLSRTSCQLAAAVRLLVSAEWDRREPIVIVDLACGGGDITRDLARRLRRLRPIGGPTIQVVGLDVSSRAVHRATASLSAADIDVSFAVRDVLVDGLPACDVAVSSLFSHHLDDAAAVQLLSTMASASRHGLVVSDLLRSRVGLALAVLGTRVLSTSRVAQVDGPLSVRAARTQSEYRRLCQAAGLQAAKIRRVWPERVLIAWERTGPPARRTPR